MDIKATPNSHRYKAEQAKASEKKVQKIVSGNVKTRKKSEMSKFKDTIFAEDVNSVKSYLFIDVIIPAIKKAIFETVTNGVDMMLYGEVRGKKRSSYDQVSYRDYSKSDRPYSSRSSTSFDLDEISFDNRGDAEAVLDGMTDILNESTYLIYRGTDAAQIIASAYNCDPTEEGIMLKGVVSRKKQLIPVLINTMAERQA